MYSVLRNIIKVVVVATILFSATYSVKGQKIATQKADITNLLIESMRLEEKDSITAQYELLNYAIKQDYESADLAYQLALVTTRLKDYQNAATYITNAANLAPDNYWYNLQAALFNMQLRRWDEGIKLYKRLVDNNPYDEELHLMLAEAYLQTNQINEALKVYDKLEVISGSIEYVAKTKASIYEHLNQIDNQIVELKRLSKAFPNDIESRLSLVKAYITKFDYVNAKIELDEVERISPDNKMLYISKIGYNRACGDLNAEHNTILQAIVSEKVDYDTKKDIIEFYINRVINAPNKTNKHNNVSDLYELMLKEYPQKAEVYIIYSEYCSVTQQYEKSVNLLKQAIALNPNDQSVWQQLSVLQYILEDYKGMDNSIVKGKQVVQNPEYNQSMAELYYAAGMENKGENLLKESLQYTNITPLQKSDAYRVLGDMSAYEGFNDMAFEYYERSLESNPDNHLTQNNYAYQLAISGGDISKAEGLSAKAISKKGDEVSYLDTYGWIFYLQENYVLAELYIKKALQNGGAEIPEILEHYGDIKYMQGDADEALKYWNESKRNGGASPELNKKIDKKGL